MLVPGPDHPSSVIPRRGEELVLVTGSGRDAQPGERDAAAPRFRIWPPVALVVPWLAGIGVEQALERETSLGIVAELVGWGLVGFFLVWNGWCLLLFARQRTGLLPGQVTTLLLREGPYRLSRNPLYVGLLALYLGTGLILSSWGVLVLAPAAWAGLWWGAVTPEEKYLAARLGDGYVEYCRAVPRWL
jgi:protein-S-isoprenylcysteine O-methyltransferase Ste14